MTDRLKELIKKWFKLVDERDYDYALSCIGDAKDRSDLEWKIRVQLFRSKP